MGVAPEMAGIALGGVLFAASWRSALSLEVNRPEARVMQAVNTQHAAMHRPLAVVMQGGSLAGGLAVAGLVGLRARGSRTGRRAGVTTAAAVTLAWLGAKGVKALTRRGRPSDHLAAIVVRGRAQRGYGFPSGHAAVSVAAAVGASKAVPAPVALALGGVAVATGMARMYVGAHLPLDIVGGLGMGAVLGCAARLAQ